MRPVLRLHLVTLAICALALLGAASGAGRAAETTLYVKTSGDDSAPCTKADPCKTIQHAVQVAVAGDTIHIGPGTFAEAGSIGIYKDMTIDGGLWLGTKVTPGGPSWTYQPVFFIGPAVDVTLKNMTITDGTLGGIDNSGDLTAENLFIWKNTGQGGIFNVGSISMTNVAIDDNKGGAGLTNYGSALVTDSHIDGSSHQGTFAGDGIDNGGTLTIDRGLIAGNEGVGLNAFWLSGHACPTTEVRNTTITNNSNGGVQATCGSTILTHATIAGNKTTLPNGGGIWFFGLDGSVSIRNSIVAKNSPGTQCFGGVSASGSLLGDSSCVGFPVDDLVGVDPKLGPLSYQGGDTLTRLFRIGASRVLPLKIGSPAIDAATTADCIPYDQLAQPRPIDGNGDSVAKCDMGAFEYWPPNTMTEG
jgi:hypothetical protein